MLKKFLSLFFVFSCFVCSLSGCYSKSDAEQIRVGTISGPETQLMQVAKSVLLKQSDLHLKIIEFSDYSLPNRALSEGSLDANMFQHQIFLDEENKQQHYHLIPIAKLFIYPMGIYSKKIQALDKIKQNAIVAIPNDPSNEARALSLLQQAGLLKLNPNAKNLATPRDIMANPKNLQIKELDAAQLTRSLPDVDAAVINTNYAVLANLYPQQDALFSENKNSAYANLLVSKEKDKDNPKLQVLVKALHSPEVLAAAQQLFHGQAIPAW
ncbi:D-methionine transport system substrate-binding protein [Candidatus Rickettsiella viridis]|uniref:Lipoprotein n=1 Tax=Candidatus Rickettsiella viridis TaxID=676208 RepID=A0A2Z5UW38_9COXI|nr:MetQ/NlpA family ABC transporter substrate-binding protein [Candidatus Rickettsiella viridis]BBB15251.1 D-methionine transport system substrate-binding protein [Candidatus Rickettsiella viridis]